MGEQGGATSVEMAVLWSAMITAVLAVVQVALVFYAGQLALTAAEEGLRAARYYGTADVAVAARRETLAFLDRAAGRTLDDASVTAAVDNAGILHVRVTGSALSLVPAIPFPVVREATGALERVAS